MGAGRVPIWSPNFGLRRPYRSSLVGPHGRLCNYIWMIFKMDKITFDAFQQLDLSTFGPHNIWNVWPRPLGGPLKFQVQTVF